jgi:acetyl esterase/lipase
MGKGERSATESKVETHFRDHILRGSRRCGLAALPCVATAMNPGIALFVGVGIATLSALAAGAGAQETAPQTVRLWAGDAPGAQGATDEDVPALTIYSPAAGKANGAAVVVCPGGGYAHLAPHEGKPIAEWLNTLGVTGFVLRYRLAPHYHHPAMMNDVNRAIRYVRAHAADWNLDPHRIGVLGFSAGGHLASTAATHYDKGDPNAADPVERVSSRPDLAVLVYPVITMTHPFTHDGSRQNLLGKEPDEALVNLMSNEKQVTPDTPPTFLLHTADDAVVPMENSLLFAMACHKANVPVELHVFPHGPHGIGLGGNDPVLSRWPELCAAWFKARGFLQASPAARTP